MSLNTCSISATQRTIMSQTSQNKASKKVATTSTTTGSSAATLPSLVLKKNQFRFLNVNAVLKMMVMMMKKKIAVKKKIQVTIVKMVVVMAVF